MALSLGVCSSLFAGGAVSFPKSSSSVPVKLLPGNMRPVRTVTITAAVSKPATETNKREPRGIMKPRRVSPEMQAFLGGVSEIPRTQALKEIWAYIKQHNLQDPADKKVIICDEQLKKILGGRDRVGFLEIAGLLNPHFLK
ncbi:protein TRI1 [Sesamum alatum]|uniref:Protein TRI1 n=1 Tax=Sesamum alatum TaxID=300844 RepID=A0AAE1Y6Z7_9LAMI|nr:protein TRI1 [Sesamum alatum]